VDVNLNMYIKSSILLKI